MEKHRHETPYSVRHAHELWPHAHGDLFKRNRCHRRKRHLRQYVGLLLRSKPRHSHRQKTYIHRKKCVLIHELVHWLHADYQCGMHEQRTRLEAARLLVDSQKYRQAEQTYEGAPWLIASELDLTIQTITDYQQCLHDFAVIAPERRCLIGTQA